MTSEISNQKAQNHLCMYSMNKGTPRKKKKGELR